MHCECIALPAELAAEGECLRHGVLLVLGTPSQLRSLAGLEHGRIIPLAAINQSRGGQTRTIKEHAKPTESHS
jgi:hypothetical protein